MNDDLAAEQRADGLAAVDPLDRLADERRDRQRRDLRDALAGGSGTVSVRTTSRSAESRDPLDRRVRTGRRGWRRRRSRSRPRARARGRSRSACPAVSISSSTMIARLPRTSPMTFMSSARSRLPIAPLLDDRERRVEELGERPGALGEPEVRHDDEVLEVLVR